MRPAIDSPEITPAFGHCARLREEFIRQYYPLALGARTFESRLHERRFRARGVLDSLLEGRQVISFDERYLYVIPCPKLPSQRFAALNRLVGVIV